MVSPGREFGEVLSVRLARWNHTQKLKGFGYVQFKTGAAAEAAVSSGDVKASGPTRVDLHSPIWGLQFDSFVEEYHIF